VGTVHAARTAFLRADAFRGMHIQSHVLCISGDFPHSRSKGTMNSPLCVSCDGNSLCSASEEEKATVNPGEKKYTSLVTCAGDSRLTRGLVHEIQIVACPLVYILASVTRLAQTIGKHSSKQTEP
jgi:hypothetical protein